MLHKVMAIASKDLNRKSLAKILFNEKLSQKVDPNMDQSRNQSPLATQSMFTDDQEAEFKVSETASKLPEKPFANPAFSYKKQFVPMKRLARPSVLVNESVRDEEGVFDQTFSTHEGIAQLSAIVERKIYAGNNSNKKMPRFRARNASVPANQTMVIPKDTTKVSTCGMNSQRSLLQVMTRPKNLFAFPVEAINGIKKNEKEAIMEQGDFKNGRNDEIASDVRIAAIRMRPGRFRQQDETALHDTLITFFRDKGRHADAADLSFAPQQFGI